MKVTVKIIDNLGYIKSGSIGVGFGAWSRAARIRDSLKLSDFPKVLPENQWRQLNAHRIEDVVIGRSK